MVCGVVVVWSVSRGQGLEVGRRPVPYLCYAMAQHNMYKEEGRKREERVHLCREEEP